MQAIEFDAEIHDSMIRLPAELQQWEDRQVRVILLETQAPAARSTPPRRQPHPSIAGKGKTQGDLLDPLVDEEDWACLT
ncbi:MAG: hypothetical protein H7842_05940 [Gammaproteobacteria bacterium SHHR-1]